MANSSVGRTRRSVEAGGGERVTRPRRIRLAIIAPSLRFVGGQSAQAALLVQKWQDDPEVEVRFVPVDPDFPPGLRWVTRVPYLRTFARMPLYLATLWRILRDTDVAHIFSASYWSFLLAPVPALGIARIRGARTLINYHSGEAEDHLSHWRTAIPFLRGTDGLAVPSNYLAEVFRRFGLEVSVVSNFIDEKQFCYHPRQPLEARLVCTRGFGAYYSVGHVVRAFAAVKREFPHATLSLAGNGPEEARVRSLVRELQLSDVEFVGAVPREKMGLCYHRADIFVNASWLDNMPLSILEAFASGTLVVSTAPEGIRRLVRHEETGLLSEPGDWRALAGNVIRLLKEPELAVRLSENGYEESKKYRWEAVRPLWLSLYRSLLLGASEEHTARTRTGCKPDAPLVMLSSGEYGTKPEPKHNRTRHGHG